MWGIIYNKHFYYRYTIWEALAEELRNNPKSFPPLFRKSQKLYIEDLEATRDVTKGIDENVIDITIM